MRNDDGKEQKSVILSSKPLIGVIPLVFFIAVTVYLVAFDPFGTMVFKPA